MSQNLNEALRQHFGHDTFREGQREVVETLLSSNNALVVMPTGAGKSLCYQLPALLLPGVTLVVSPLIALMKDQVDALAQRDLPATFVNSTLDWWEALQRLEGLARGDYKLVYVAPERFKNERFLEALSQTKVSLFAVDEAHCISQWGHDFRPDYLRLSQALETVGHPAVAAFTATATPRVRRDIIQQLHLEGALEYFVGFDRKNLFFRILHVRRMQEKLDAILEVLKRFGLGKKGKPGRRGSAIIYCATRKNVDKVAAFLEASRFACVGYHAGLSDARRKKVQDLFMSGELPVVVATNAFGLGIDKPDIRAVIHYDLPGSVEAYYQEAGRAGRDDEPAECPLLFSQVDLRTQEFFVDISNPAPATVTAAYRALCDRGTSLIEVELEALAAGLPGKARAVAAEAAIKLLEREGHLLRLGGEEKRMRLRLLDRGPLRLDLRRLASKRKRDEERLARMVSYAWQKKCRRSFILSYFGDPSAPSRCLACDACVAREGTQADDTPAQERREPTEDEVVLMQKVLSCVARMRGRFGKRKVAQVLCGSRQKQVLEWKLNRLPTYGLLGGLSQGLVEKLLDELIAVDCLSVEVSDSKYPKVSLTPLGRDVMHRKATVPVGLPPEALPRKPGPDPKGRQPNREDAGRPATPLKVRSAWVSLEAFRRLGRVDPVAEERGLKRRTIVAHLVECLDAGEELDLARELPEARRKRIEEAIVRSGQAERAAPVKSLLPRDYTWDELHLALAHYRSRRGPVS